MKLSLSQLRHLVNEVDVSEPGSPLRGERLTLTVLARDLPKGRPFFIPTKHSNRVPVRAFHTKDSVRLIDNRGRKLVTLRPDQRVTIEEGLNEDASASLNGVSEWMLREDVSEFVDRVRKRIKGFVLINKSENPNDQREAIAAMNDVCDDLEKKVYEVLEEAVWAFTRRV